MSTWAWNPCRLCLQENSTIPILNDDPFYLEAFYIASGVKVLPTDKLPQQICNKCFIFINRSRYFRRKCLVTQKALLDFFSYKSINFSNIQREDIDLLRNQLNLALDMDLDVQNIDLKSDLKETNNIKINNDVENTNIIKKSSTDQDLKQVNSINQDLNSNNDNLSDYKAEVNENDKDLKENMLYLSTDILPIFSVDDSLNCNREHSQTNYKQEAHNNEKLNPKRNNINDRKNNKYEKEKCKVCAKEIMLKSMSKHLKRHKLYGKELRKGRKKLDKSLKRPPMGECNECGKKMAKKHLSAHFQIHDGTPKKLICKHCDKRFDRPFGLLRHCRAKHGYEKIDKCSYCSFMGCSQYEVRVHERLHTRENPYSCEVCGDMFKSKATCSQHMAEHGDTRIKCPACPEIFQSSKQLSQHKFKKHKHKKLTYQCPICLHTAMSKSIIQDHILKKHGENNKTDILKIYGNVNKKNDSKKDLKATKKDSSLNNISTSDGNKALTTFTAELSKDNKLSVNNKDLIIKKAIVEEENTLNLQVMDLKQLTDVNIDSNYVNNDQNNSYFNVKVLKTDDKDLKMKLNTKYEDLSLNKEDLNENNDNDKNEIDEVKKGKKNDETILQKQKRLLPKVECDVCGKKMAKRDFELHFVKHIDKTMKPIICEHCGLRFGHKKYLLSHCKSKHGYEKTAKCSYCDYRGLNSYSIKVHERLHTGEKPYSCNICDKKFRLQITCKFHIARHDEGNQNRIQCEICRKNISKNNYYTHKKRHNTNYTPPLPRIRPYVKCDVCGTMVLENNLKEHFSIHTGQAKTVPCQHCHQSFSRPSRLLRHCRAKHGYEKIDKCTFCDYKGCSRAEVKLHERTHTGERPFSCEICHLKFRYTSDRQKHMAKEHGKTQMAQCEVCSKTFLTPRLLSEHKYEKHPKNIYSYQCTLCPKVYKRRGAAKRHIVNHHAQSYSAEKIVKLKI